MSPEPFDSRAKAPPAKRRERGNGDENENLQFYDKKLASVRQSLRPGQTDQQVVASRPKFSTCGYLRLRLARALVPLCNLRPSIIYSVPCDRIVQKAYSLIQEIFLMNGVNHIRSKSVSLTWVLELNAETDY